MAKKMVDECDSGDEMGDVSMVISYTLYGNLKIQLLANHDKISGEADNRCIHPR